ncbi:hypothetical protein DFQ26_004069, partial [Actinomortierella ambigua]
MEALKYHASKHQRNLVNRFNRFVSDEGDETFERDIQAQLSKESSKPPDTAEKGENGAQPAATNTGVHATTASATEGDVAPLSNDERKALVAAEAKRQKQKQKKVLKEMPQNLVDKIHLAEYSRHPDQTAWRHRFK